MAVCLYLIYIFLICSSCVINRQSMSFFRLPLCTSDYIDLFIHRSLIMLPPLVLLSLYVYVYLNRRRNLISTVVIVLLFHHTQRQYLSNIPSNKFYSSFFFFFKITKHTRTIEENEKESSQITFLTSDVKWFSRMFIVTTIIRCSLLVGY